MPKRPSATPQPIERRGYRVDEWCEAFRCSRDTAYKMMRDGRLRYVDIGGRRFIPVEAAEALVEAAHAST
jgi:excisionase family DNA binding protein